jgi:hypothetical protein
VVVGSGAAISTSHILAARLAGGSPSFNIDRPEGAAAQASDCYAARQFAESI